MNEPLDEQYLTWLYSQVGAVKLKTQSRTHWDLLRHLYKKEFKWFVANDDNRCEDGKDLRYEFLDAREIDENDVDPEWMHMPCSMLEMLIALSRRLSFETETEARLWFWHLIETMGILHSDKDYDQHREEIDEAVERVIWRTYDSDGKGGLFPLNRPQHDQRYVEIWYQLSAYLLELNV
jgi:hypothetical protein